MVVFGGLGLTGCERAALDESCPKVIPGALAITELRGPQDGPDTWGQWIELHNSTSASIALAGLSLRLRKPDGSAEVDLIVRDHALSVPAGGYVVLGRVAPEVALPKHVSYSYAGDFDGDLYPAGLLELESCGTPIGRVSWMALPPKGTLSQGAGGTWCPDTHEETLPTPAALGLPGTPGRENSSCSP